MAAHPMFADPFGTHSAEGRVEPARYVDHMVPNEKGGRGEEGKLQALCHACHSEKTAREDERWG